MTGVDLQSSDTVDRPSLGDEDLGRAADVSEFSGPKTGDQIVGSGILGCHLQRLFQPATDWYVPVKNISIFKLRSKSFIIKP